MESRCNVKTNRRTLKIRYENRLETLTYYPGKTSFDDLVGNLRLCFRIAADRNFVLRAADGSVFVFGPIDVDLDEVFLLEVESEILQGHSDCFSFPWR